MISNPSRRCFIFLRGFPASPCSAPPAKRPFLPGSNLLASRVKLLPWRTPPRAQGTNLERCELMKTLLKASTQKPRESRVAALLRLAPDAAAARGAARRVTCELKEQKDRPLPDAAPHTESAHVRFDRFFPDAREVNIAGSFNGGQPAASPMERFGMGCGQWKVDLYLKPGR